MELRKLTVLTAEMMIANMTPEQPERWINPRRWTAANDTRKPPSGKDRSKVKAARKQRHRK
jgi:hypothetical protein